MISGGRIQLQYVSDSLSDTLLKKIVIAGSISFLIFVLSCATTIAVLCLRKKRIGRYQELPGDFKDFDCEEDANLLGEKNRGSNPDMANRIDDTDSGHLSSEYNYSDNDRKSEDATLITEMKQTEVSGRTPDGITNATDTVSNNNDC